MGIVYIHSNLSNDKVYVGQTWNPAQRELDHKNPSSKSVFSKAVQRYGWRNFNHYFSEEISSQEKLDDLEKAWIILLESTNKSRGYNLRFGGSRGRHTDRTKHLLKLARSRQGPPSEEGRKRIREANLGNSYGVGWHPNEEQRHKMSLAHLGKKQSPEWIRKRMESSQKTRQSAQRRIDG